SRTGKIGMTVGLACSLLASPSAHPPQTATSGRQFSRATVAAGCGSPQHPHIEQVAVRGDRL
ncbi:MAG: hypothetical protein ACRDS9_04160, partial [Pseudonocardiaceae bacterium]